MSFKLLKKVIAELRRKERCPNCAAVFSEDFVFVLATAFRVKQGASSSDALLVVICEQCLTSAFVAVEVKSLRHKIKHEFFRFDTKVGRDGVSADEILDMRNFLKSYQGELSELFKGNI